MKEFNKIEEIEKYYNENTKTYQFIENGCRFDVKFKHFCLDSEIEYKTDKETINIGGKNYEITEELKNILKELKEI